MDPNGITQPLDIDPQLRQRLFHDPAASVGQVDPDRCAGDPASQHLDVIDAGTAQPIGVTEIGGELCGVLDVQFDQSPNAAGPARP